MSNANFAGDNAVRFQAVFEEKSAQIIESDAYTRDRRFACAGDGDPAAGEGVMAIVVGQDGRE